MTTKHYQLLVPSYDGSSTSALPAQAPLSYLRLGAAFSSSDDNVIADSNRGHEWIKNQLNTAGTYFFKDDKRAADGRTEPAKTYHRYDGNAASSTSDPSTLTAELLSRGGWYEHTDGNRLSTTRGDCLEVIGGNYRMVIMGRVEGGNVGRSHWESSGGHNHLSTSTPGEVQTITWSADVETGTWEVFEQTDRGHEISRFQGKKEDHYFGPSTYAEVGPGTDASVSFNTEKPIVRDEIYAKKSESVTNCNKLTETTDLKASVTKEEFQQADKVKSFTGGCPLKEVHTTIGKTYANNIKTKHAFGTRHFYEVGMMSFSIETGNVTNKFAGHKFGITLAVTMDVQLAASLSINMGMGLSFAAVAKTDVHIGAQVGINLSIFLGVGLKYLAIGVVKGIIAYGEVMAAANENRGAAGMFYF